MVSNKCVSSRAGTRLFTDAEEDAIRLRLEAGETAMRLAIEKDCHLNTITNAANRSRERAGKVEAKAKRTRRPRAELL